MKWTDFSLFPIIVDVLMEIEEEGVGKEEIWGIRPRINGSNLWSELLQVMNMAVVAYLYFLFAIYVFVAYLYFLFAVYVFVAYQDCLCSFVTNALQCRSYLYRPKCCLWSSDQVLWDIKSEIYWPAYIFSSEKNCGYAG